MDRKMRMALATMPKTPKSSERMRTNSLAKTIKYIKAGVMKAQTAEKATVITPIDETIPASTAVLPRI